MVSVEALKLAAALMIFLVNLVSGLMTLWAIKKATKKTKIVEAIANSITAGLFLGIVFLLLVPELPIAEEEVRQTHHLTFNFPITSVSTVFGFVLMLIIDASIKRWKQRSIDLEIGTEMTDFSHPTCAVSPSPLLPTSSSSSAPTSLFKFILFTTLMSLHSFFEGLPLGYKKTSADVIAFAIPMLIHKALEAVTVASAGQKEKKQHVLLGCLLHSVMTPAGAFVGCLVNGEGHSLVKDSALLVIMGLGVGSIIYITFIEVMAPLLTGEDFDGTSNFLKVGGITAGFVITFVVTMVIGFFEHIHI